MGDLVEHRVREKGVEGDVTALRVGDDPPLDVTAIDNLPSMLPLESSEDFAEQLLPTLLTLAENGPVWRRAADEYANHRDRL